MSHAGAVPDTSWSSHSLWVHTAVKGLAQHLATSLTGHPKSVCCVCREVVEKVQSLKAQLSDTQTELASLQQQYSLSEKRLVRASKLISALGDEAGRWGISADTLATRLQLLIGQSLWRVFNMWYMSLTRYVIVHSDTKGVMGEIQKIDIQGGGRNKVRWIDLVTKR